MIPFKDVRDAPFLDPNSQQAHDVAMRGSELRFAKIREARRKAAEEAHQAALASWDAKHEAVERGEPMQELTEEEIAAFLREADRQEQMQ